MGSTSNGSNSTDVHDDAARRLADFMNRALAPEVAFFPEHAVEYANKHSFRVQHHVELHKRLC